MDSMILAFSFAVSVVIAASVVLLFSPSIDEALARVIPAEMFSAWRRYVKFGLFVVCFAGGLRVSELAAFVTTRVPAGPPLTAAQSLMEVLKSVTGSLIAAAAALLAFFAVTLVLDVSRRLYATRSAEAASRSRASERAAAAPEREPASARAVGAERHQSKERRTSGEPGRFL